MENLFDTVLAMKKYKLSPEQMLLESNINIECEGEATKILAVNSRVCLDSQKECTLGECLISGKLTTNIIYLDENGNINSQTSVSPFGYKISNENIDATSKMNINVCVVGSEVDKLINNQLKIVTTIGFDSVLVKNNQVEYLKDGDKETFVKQQEMSVVGLESQICDKFEEKLEYSVKNGVKKILHTNVECLLQEWECGPNFVSAKFDVCAKVLYADNQDPSELQTITISKTVKQEIEAEGVNKESILDVFSSIIFENIVTELSENGEEITICVTVPIMVCLNCYKNNKILAVSDMYSCKDVISMQKESMDNTLIIKPEYIEGKVEGSLTIDENQPRIDKFLAVTNVMATNSNAYVKDSTLWLEGIVSANIIYLNDESGSIESVTIEVPYVLEKKVEAGCDVILEPLITVFDVDVMVKRGREIYFDAKAKAFVNISCIENFDVITNVQAIDKLPEKEGAIEIYFAKAGETFWEIAKNLKISSELIRTQNPELADPLNNNENITIYFQKSK